jgi:hypothetical protein
MISLINLIKVLLAEVLVHTNHGKEGQMMGLKDKRD